MFPLPPCKETIKLHSALQNYVSKMWRWSLQCNIEAPNFSCYGWDSEGTIYGFITDSQTMWSKYFLIPYTFFFNNQKFEQSLRKSLIC